MDQLIVDVLTTLFSYSLWLQFIIVVPFFYAVSCLLLCFVRLIDLTGYHRSKETYYKYHYDPLTWKKLLLRALGCTVFFIGIYLNHLYDIGYFE